jgi:hypothetical protein
MQARTDQKALSASCTMGVRGGVNRPVRGFDHGPPSSVGLRMGWIYTSNFPLCLLGHVMS